MPLILKNSTMNYQNENRFSMQRAVVSFDETVSPSIKALMPRYSVLMEDLANKNALIGTLSGSNNSSLKGYQENKSNKKEVLITTVMTITFATRAYAITEENNVLLAKTKAITKSKLQKMRDSKTADTAEEIISIATGIQTDLNSYGITTTLLSEANNLLINFRAELAIPRNKIAARKLVTQQIKKLFKEASQILYHLDALVNTIGESEPDFKDEYFINRKIINYHGSKLSVRGFVKTADGVPIQNVTITLLNGKRETKTTSRGYFEFKNLPTGIDTLLFEKVQFNEYRTTIGVIKGERVQLEITLDNAQSNVA